MAEILGFVRNTTACLVFSAWSYFFISKLVFDTIYITSNMVVDEEFHIALGQAYCELDFSKWDPKVTTLPGLYMVSTMILAPFGACRTYWLRFVSFLSSVINIFLFFNLFTQHERSEWRNILSSFTLAILPPLYFFSNLYYTDIVALTMVLMLIVFSENDLHFTASIFGMLAVACRQTNVIWVAMVTAKYTLGELHATTMQRSIPRDADDEYAIPEQNFFPLLTQIQNMGRNIIMNVSLQFLLDFASYFAIILTFVLFVILNSGIVVGDKSAHEFNVHFPQLFYFSLFCLIFAWPHFVGEVINFTVFARHHKLLILASILVGLFIVHVNTLVHPYLLADNRHYIFYIWTRFYEKYTVFRYLMVPVYIFAWYVIIKLVYDRNDIRYSLLYLPCVFLVLVPQKLVDIRYFFVPYILFRVRIKNTTATVFNVILEFVTYILINAITLNLFFTKPIVWDDYEIPQRLIW